MSIQRLPTDQEAELQGFRGPESQRRREVLRETLQAFERCSPRDHYHRVAAANLEGWGAGPRVAAAPSLRVLSGDWGDVALMLTKEFGACFAVLNMANAYFPGGAYGEGAVAQEENMFRRSDCHFALSTDELAADGRRYTAAMTALISGQDGAVYLDTASPRVCIRGAEDRSRADLGYRWLAESEIFPFFELRAAAQDLRDGSRFDEAEARRRIAAILDTLIARGLRHAVLGALGCGAFRNPPALVARLFREEIARRDGAFEVLAFAIYSAGYGPENHAVFRAAFEQH